MLMCYKYYKGSVLMLRINNIGVNQTNNIRYMSSPNFGNAKSVEEKKSENTTKTPNVTPDYNVKSLWLTTNSMTLNSLLI